MPLADTPPSAPPAASPGAYWQAPQHPPSALPVAVPVSAIDIALTAEQVAVADGPKMGLVGLHALRPVTPGLRIGPSVFGAVSGDRGGFFGWGLSAAYRWRQGAWSAEAGLFVGGGGGSPAWVGSGLMLRPSLIFARDIGPLRLGLGLSQVHFPSGTVRSTQPTASLSWTGDTLVGPAGGGPGWATEGWSDRAWPYEVAASIGQYTLRAGSARRDGSGSGTPLRVAGLVVRRDLPGDAGLGLVLLKIEREIGPQWRLVGRAGIAAHGAAGGYATGQLGVGWLGRALFDERWRFGAEATLGAAGGGGVAVGSGLIGQAQGVARYAVTPAWALQIDAGALRRHNGPLATPFVGLSSVVSFSRLQAP